MRAVFAVFGFIAFYAITIGTIVGLVWLGFLILGVLPEVHNGKGIIIMLLLGVGCLLAAGVLAWSALPRIDRFEPPGPELTEAEQPELFAMIREVASATGQRMPVHVYAVLDVNAFVTERGGIMGIGSRRVMGIGLGLLNAFSVDEVRAVLAHEFGHFHGGDTRLGPWVYKTRGAMGRAVINLQSTHRKVSEIGTLSLLFALIEAPFRWMALGYMRLASAVSRAQEYSADAVAARAIGTQPMLSGFRKLAGTAAAFDAYLDSEISTLVSAGVLPPVLAGARQFVDANRERLAEIDADHAKFGEANPFDSHPPLSERIAAIERLGGAARTGAADDRVALALVRDPEQLVRSFITERVDKPLEHIEWDAVAPHFVAQQHRFLQRHRQWLESRSVAQLDRQSETARAAVQRLEGIGEHVHQLDTELLTRLAAQVYIAALSVALEHAGYVAKTNPGEPLMFHRGETVLDPSKIVRAYLAKELSDTDWCTTWRDAGLPDQPWATIAWQAAR